MALSPSGVPVRQRALDLRHAGGLRRQRDPRLAQDRRDHTRAGQPSVIGIGPVDRQSVEHLQPTGALHLGRINGGDDLHGQSCRLGGLRRSWGVRSRLNGARAHKDR